MKLQSMLEWLRTAKRWFLDIRNIEQQPELLIQTLLQDKCEQPEKK